MFESRISTGASEKLLESEKMVRMLPPRRDMRRNGLNSTANWQTRQSINCTRCPHHVLTAISSKKEELGTVGALSKVCSQIVLVMLVFDMHR